MMNNVDLTKIITYGGNNFQQINENVYKFERLVNDFEMLVTQNAKVADKIACVKKMKQLYKVIASTNCKISKNNEDQNILFNMYSKIRDADANIGAMYTDINVMQQGGAKNDEIVVNNDNPTIVLFYADWCGHCKSFKPVWEAFEGFTDKSKLNVVKTNDTDICKKYGVNGYPTIRVYKNIKNKNEYAEYNERTIESLADFVNSLLKSDVVKLK